MSRPIQPVKPVTTSIHDYHLDLYMTAAPQVAANGFKQPVWVRNQQPSIYATLYCIAPDPVKGKKAQISIKIVDKKDQNVTELDLLRLHEFQHEINTKPPILQARSQDLSWQVRWRTTHEPNKTGPDLYRRAQLVFLSYSDLEDFISITAPLLATRRLSSTSATQAVPASSFSSSRAAPRTSSSPAPAARSSSSSSFVVRRQETAFHPSTAQDEAPISALSKSGSSSSKGKAKSKKKGLDPVDEEGENEDATAPSSETEMKREKAKKKKDKKDKKAEQGPTSSPPPRVEPLPPSSASRPNPEGASSSNSTTSPEASISSTPLKLKSGGASKSSSSSSGGRASSSHPLTFNDSQWHAHNDPHYRPILSPGPPATYAQPSALRAQTSSSTAASTAASKPRSNPAPAPEQYHLLLDLAGLDFGNGAVAVGLSSSSTTVTRPSSSSRATGVATSTNANANPTTDFFSLIDLQSPLVSPLRASNVPLPDLTLNSYPSDIAKGRKRAVEHEEGDASSKKQARTADPLLALDDGEFGELLMGILEEKGFRELVDRVGRMVE